ncbi:MAG TPA: DUF2891 domain-containing protein [Caulobacteraceae bacterium]|jgi:hypothetical protein|nr:DUF2891 domain-containing protein [Caulobacteraceae bacterium]
MIQLDAQLADRLAALALGHVARPWPYAPGHVLTGPADLVPPREVHPIFFGSFDWHSCVHAHWLLARLIRLYPDIPSSAFVRRHFDQAFTKEKVTIEAAWFERPANAGFERPYGWAWLLALAAELRADPSSAAWNEALGPLAAVITRRFAAWFPKADYPVRAGTRGNTAFALALAHDFARAAADEGFRRLIEEKALAWYLVDADCQAWEPSGDDFLSPALVEAELMRRVLGREEFLAWFAAFLPRLAAGEPAALLVPALVSDRKDGKIAHLDGLNLSRAWCWRSLAAALPSDARAVALEAAAAHLAASLPHLDADYAGAHWLATFALLAVDPGEGLKAPET